MPENDSKTSPIQLVRDHDVTMGALVALYDALHCTLDTLGVQPGDPFEIIVRVTFGVPR